MTLHAIRRRILLSAPCPDAVLAAMPPLPRSQRAWFVKLCADMANAMAAVQVGKRDG